MRSVIDVAARLAGRVLSRPQDKAPVPYVGRPAGTVSGFMAPSGTSAYMHAYGTNGSLFGIVSRIANALSKVDWHLYRKAASGLDEDRIEIPSGQHLALNIWEKPNDFYTGQRFREAVQQHLDLTGEGWPIVERNPVLRSLPLGLWPVRPDRMMPVPSPKNFLDGYVYRSPDGELIPLGLDEVQPLIMSNPLDPYRGLGPVQAILMYLDSSKYSAEWNRNFFLNSAAPGGLIEVESSLGDDEFLDFQKRWREAHQGLGAAHRVAFLEAGMKWVDRNFTQKDMQFVELDANNREAIREAFGYPKPLTGAVDDVNRANAEAGEVVFGRWLLVPRLERWKGWLNSWYLPLFGVTAQGLEFDYDNPVPEDKAAEVAEIGAIATAFKTYGEAGTDPGWAAELLGLPKPKMAPKPDPPPLPPAAPPGADPETLAAVAAVLRPFFNTIPRRRIAPSKRTGSAS